MGYYIRCSSSVSFLQANKRGEDDKTRTFQEYLKEIKPQVDERIEEICKKKLMDPDVIPMLLKGKRLRAGLLLLVFDSIAEKNNKRNVALNLACAIEMAHSASLILDDMLDEDTERRGLPTIHLKKGHKKAMLQTIGVLSMPYDIISPYGELFVGTLAETQRGMVRGVVKELWNAPDLPATAIYSAVITNKTGKLFSLAALWGQMAVRCYCCNIHDKYCSHKNEMIYFASYGMRCGRAMQVADDIADLKQVLEGKKKNGFGSELLLMKCMKVDRLIKEFFRDLKNNSLSVKRAKHIMSDEGMRKNMSDILDGEIREAKNALGNLHFPYIEYEEILMDAPGGIAELMLKEG